MKNPTSQPLRAILVCVDYSDYLSVTLPYNRHHFSEVMVVTSTVDEQTVEVAKANNAKVFRTASFYTDGARFNKFRALEEGLDVFGRHGWLCIMDADILWPKHIDWSFLTADRLCETPTGQYFSQHSYLYTPLRRMWEDCDTNIPQEPYWSQFPLHPQQVEWAGYTQIFHADDPALGLAPWHQTNWRHAGGADSWFQRKWSNESKLRPPFTCLHLGKAGHNWCGRATPYLDGSVPPETDERLRDLRHFMRMRQATRSYQHEKL